jgi:hypothetical protein
LEYDLPSRLVIVVVQREARREVVPFVEVGLEQQLCIDVLLVHAIVFLTIVGIQQMHRGITHHSNVRAVLRIEDEGVLHIALVAVRLDTDFVEVRGEGREVRGVLRLATLTLFLDEAHAPMEDVAVALPFPAVLQVPLAYVRLVEETVTIHVMVSEVILVVGQHLCAQSVVQVDVGIGIGLQTALGIAEEVYCHALIVVGFQVLHIDLSRDTLIAVTHG